MIIDQSLMDTVRESSCDFSFDLFKKIVNELNFEDGISGVFTHGANGLNDKWIQVEFDNFWVLNVWDDGEISLETPNASQEENIFNADYKELLEYMEEVGIRKAKQCDYKDAELYVVDFNR